MSIFAVPGSLLADITEEATSEALSTGNLKRRVDPNKIQPSPWTGEKSWVSLGYIARVQHTRCVCGEHSSQLLGLFHREKSPSGAVVLQALSPKAQIPLNQNYPIEFIDLDVTICPECLDAHGFSLKAKV